jgi:hypothetical protein
MTHLLLTGHDAVADRAVLQALVSFQKDTPPSGPVRTRQQVLSGLATFQARAVAAAAQPFSDRQRLAFERALGLLADAHAAQAVVALHPQLGGGRAGPLSQDIACLLRHQRLDDDLELDLAVRWWQLARSAGLPVDADFGETWRTLEWTALVQQLMLLANSPGSEKATEGSLLERASQVALRYGSLKCLAQLLHPLGGAAPGAGFTF